MEHAKDIKDIFDSSDKAQLIEDISDVLDTEGCKVVIITGVPKEDGNLEMYVRQTGHKYVFEAVGFLGEAIDILQTVQGDNENERE